jgi:hypothetical protein
VATNKSLQINVEGAKALRESLKALGDRALLGQLSKDNARIGDMVVRHAQGLAAPGRESIVAGRMKSVKSSGNVSVRLPQMVDVNDKRGLRPIGMGTEFGAYRNRRRLVKNTGGRKTIVRDGEDINKVIERVENQTIMRDRFGGSSTMPKRYRSKGAEAVKVTKVIRGWNGFRPWRGNAGRAGYFLFPAIRRNRELIIDLYMESVQRVWQQHKAA